MAETATNPIDSTMLTVETPITIDTVIRLLNPQDLPMLGGVMSDGYPMVARQPVDNTVWFWMDDEFLAPRTLLAEDLDNSETGVDITTNQGEAFAAGDTILIDNEIMFVTGVSNDTLTVVRGSAGTTAAAHTTGAEVLGLGTILNEGSIGDEQFTGRTKYSNYTQIFTSKISITRTAQAINKYGMPGGELPRQIRKVLWAEAVNMEQSLLYGVKWASGNRRSTGGISSMLTTNVIGNGASGDWLTVNEVSRMQQVAYDAGGGFSHLVGNAAIFAALDNLNGDRISQVEMTDGRRGRVAATQVLTRFGPVTLHSNRWVRATEAFGLNPADISARVFQQMMMQPLAKTDDKDSWMFVAELGWQLKGERHMVHWTELNTAGEFPADLV